MLFFLIIFSSLRVFIFYTILRDFVILCMVIAAEYEIVNFPSYFVIVRHLVTAKKKKIEQVLHQIFIMA